MNKYKLPLWLPLLVLFAIGIAGFWAPNYVPAVALLAKNGVNEQWLGFAGAVLGAAATLLTGIFALLAAYKTLIPMRRQLDQLIKQNDHNLYDRLLLRAVRLNEEEILIRRVVDDCNDVDRALRKVLLTSKFLPETKDLTRVVDKLGETVRALSIKKGEVWGDVTTQRARNAFIDMAVGCYSVAGSMAERVRTLSRIAIVTEKKRMTNWDRLYRDMNTLADRLFRLVMIEAEKTGEEIASAERRLLGERKI